MAKRGAQPGNTNASNKNRPFADAIRRALADQDGKKLRQIAEKLIARALEGDTSALKEIADRLDGKPKQDIDVGGDIIVQITSKDAAL